MSRGITRNDGCAGTRAFIQIFHTFMVVVFGLQRELATDSGFRTSWGHGSHNLELQVVLGVVVASLGALSELTSPKKLLCSCEVLISVNDPILTRVHRHAFFRGFSMQEITWFADCARAVDFEPNALIARHGDSADEFYAIESGIVGISAGISNGSSNLVQTLQSGDIVGWSWVSGGSQWSFDVMSLQHSRLLAFDSKCILRKCQADPALGYRLMRRLCEVLSERLISTRLRLLKLYDPIREKYV